MIRVGWALMDLGRFDNAAFDRGVGRPLEALWHLVRAAVLLNPMPFPSVLRATLLRLFGSRVGRRVVLRSRLNVSFPWRLEIGDDVWIGDEVFILSLAPVKIESNVCVSQRVFLCTGSHDHRREDFALITNPITIRSGSWVAAQAFVGPGVEIGPGSVVSAGSVVLENVPPYTLVRGNPAQVAKEVPRPAPTDKAAAVR